MTTALQQAFQIASALPQEQQDSLAAILIEELASDERWQASFARSQGALAKLPAEALAEHTRGETRDLDESL